MKPARRALFIGYIWPEPESTAAGVRMVALLEHFRRAGYELHFAAGSKINSFAERLGRTGVHLHEIRVNDSSFDPWIAELSPEVVVFDRFMIEEQYGWRVEEFSPRSLRVVDSVDLHSLRRAREQAFREGRPLDDIYAVRVDLDLQEDALREIASVHRADLTLMISPFETELLVSRFGVDPDRILTLGFSVESSGGKGEREATPAGEREHFVMIGNFRHPPNRDAVDWVRAEIWPRIRATLPRAELHVYGAYPPKDAMGYDDPASGFRMRGPCEDAIATVAKYRVALAPLRFGAGLKGKILDAWRARTPVVTTPIGSEGMEFQTRFAGRIGRDADEIARLARELYSDEREQERIRLEGDRAVAGLYGFERNQELLMAEIERRLQDLEGFRRRNFIGRMLTHHQMKSLKYFSRWIEEKEKRLPRP